MIALLRSEVLKLRTTRTALGLTLGMIALTMLVGFATGYGSTAEALSHRKEQFQLFASGSIAAAFAAILGLLAMTTEFRHGTIRPTFLAAPRRRHVVTAKVAASTIVGALLGLVGLALSLAIAELVLHTRDIPLELSNRDLVLVVCGTIASSALWGAFAAGLGAIIRNQVGGIVGLLIYTLFVESILFALFPSQARYLPGEASNVLTQVETPHLLGVAAGTLLFAAYIAAAWLAGVAVTERRDVS